MLKYSRLLILLLILSLIPFSGMALAQEDPEVDVLADIVQPRLEEYGENLPDHYGTINLESFLELLADEEVTIVDVREDGEIEEFGIIED